MACAILNRPTQDQTQLLTTCGESEDEPAPKTSLNNNSDDNRPNKINNYICYVKSYVIDLEKFSRLFIVHLKT